jgi:internalin A
LLEQGPLILAGYLRSLENGVPQYEVKVLMVGEGNVGKTSLVAALRGDPFKASRLTTHGIEVRPLDLPHPRLDVTLTARTWDFGGQEVYRVSHQFFYSGSAVYLVAWKPRDGQEQNQVEGWLRRIRLRVRDDARALIVAAHCAGGRQPDLDYPASSVSSRRCWPASSRSTTKPARASVH